MTEFHTCAHHSGIEAELKKLCLLIEERKELANIRINQIREEVVLARTDMERRLDDMNEFRSQLTNQASTFATRHELKAEAEKLDLKLAPLLSQQNFREGSMKWTDHILTVIIAAAVMLVFKLLHV
jgi:hypothetical protein